MKETPLICATNMVTATLDGSKTQTRRIIKPQPTVHLPYNPPDGLYFPIQYKCKGDPITKEKLVSLCPYGLVGDRLWVKETFARRLDGVDQILYKQQYGELVKMFAEADKDRPDWLPEAIPFPNLKWTPSIHMPRKDSRITLEITGVRVERLQDISEGDAIAEGVKATLGKNIDGWRTAIDDYKDLWDSIYAKRGWGWVRNLWVWVISFKIITV